MTTVSFKADHREGKLKELFNAHPVLKDKVIWENLEYGDFQLLFNGNISFIFERKATDDLLASIKDGRYNNQKAKLFAVFQPSQVYYIIEGRMTFKQSEKQTTTEKILNSSVINMTLRDKIGCFQTANIAETFDLLCGIYQRFSADPAKYLEATGHQQEYLKETPSSMSSSPHVKSNVWKAILCQIPGINSKASDVIMKKWDTFSAMYGELQPLEPVQREKVLNDLKSENEGTNGRRLGKRVTEGLIAAFF
jgi:ERCC4-type nuclease